MRILGFVLMSALLWPITVPGNEGQDEAISVGGKITRDDKLPGSCNMVKWSKALVRTLVQ